MSSPLIIPRSRHLTRLEALAADPGLVTVLGPPGVGKTHLVRQFLAGRSASDHWFCDLTDVHSSDGLVDRVAATVGVQQLGSLDVAAARQLGERLSQLAPFLLVLDNFEQLVADAAPLLAEWVERCPGSLFVVTSRHALRLRVERRVELRPLTGEQAERLFVARAQAVAPDWTFDESMRPALQALLERLDGLPLAIELAAARAGLFSLGEMVRRFALVPVPVPDVGFVDTDTRHRSVFAAIRWSWDLLDADEQQAFMQLAVFRGGFTLAAAESVVRLGESSRPTLAVLRGLRDKSLLARHIQDDPEGGHRFTLYASLREFAESTLEERGQLEATRTRHADHYINAAVRWRLQIVGENAEPALHGLLVESANLEAIYEWARERDPPRNAMALLALSEVVFVRGGFERHAARLRRALETPAVPFVADQLRVELGISLFLGGRPREAYDALRDIEPPAGLVALEARWRILMANVLRTLGRTKAGESHLRAGLERARSASDPHVESVLLCFLGSHLWHTGQLAEAEGHFEEALRLNRAVPNPRNHSRTLAYLGMLRMEQERYDEARRLLSEAESTHVERRERVMVARARLARALVEVWDGRLAEAERIVEESLTIARRVGEGWVEAMSLSLRSMLAVLRSDLEAAARARDAVAPLAERLGDPAIIEAFSWADWLLTWAEGPPNGRRAKRYATADWVDDSQGAHLPLRLLRSLRQRVGGLAGVGPPTTELEDRPRLRLGPECKWFQPSGEEQLSLRRRKSLRAILQLLADSHQTDPQRTLPRKRLQAVGWPGEKMRPDSGAKRVHVAIWTLRRLGLRDVIETVDGEYRLFSDVVVERVG